MPIHSDDTIKIGAQAMDRAGLIEKVRAYACKYWSLHENARTHERLDITLSNVRYNRYLPNEQVSAEAEVKLLPAKRFHIGPKYTPGDIITNLEKPVEVISVHEFLYVESQSKPGMYYRVTWDGCTCPDHTHRLRVCKHMQKVRNT